MTPRSGSAFDLCVVGAGVIGTWTALEAVERGLSVCLVDQFGPGDPRATSGDESRITRASHGQDRLYPIWSREALARWIALAEEAGSPIFEPCGVVWFSREEQGFVADSEATLRSLGIPAEHLSPSEAAARWPIRTDDLAFVLYEPEAGALRARQGVRAAAAAFERRGGVLRRGRVRPGSIDRGRLADVAADDGSRIGADAFAFAAGPWLARLFPGLLRGLISVTRQDVLYLGADPAGPAMDAATVPAWVDDDEAFYGIPAIDGRGFKAAPDSYGPPTDPDRMDRVIEPGSVEVTRAFLARRFPALADAPVIETRVCQYETTPDTNWLIDRHPELENLWLAGGGSGHAFKHGPRIGRYVVDRIMGVDADPAIAARFSLSRERPLGRGMRSGVPTR